MTILCQQCMEYHEFGPGVLTIICSDCACIIIAEHGEHFLVVGEVVRNQHRPALFHRRCQFLEHTCPGLPWLIPGLDGLACERIERDILLIEIVHVRGCLRQQFAGAVSKKLMNRRHNETDNMIAASETLDL